MTLERRQAFGWVQGAQPYERRMSEKENRTTQPVMSHIDVDQAKSRLEELIDQVARGEEVVITKDDQPVARLSAVAGKPQRQFGSAKGEIWMSEDFDEPLEEFGEYM